MTEIIKRAEQWLASIDGTRLFDGAGAEPLKGGPELVRALVETLKKARLYITDVTKEVGQLTESVLDAEDNARLYKRMYERKTAQPSGINPDWPGNPGEGD